MPHRAGGGEGRGAWTTMVGRTDWAEASTSRASGGAGPSRAATKGGKDRWLERAVVSAKETNLLRLCNRA